MKFMHRQLSGGRDTLAQRIPTLAYNLLDSITEPYLLAIDASLLYIELRW